MFAFADQVGNNAMFASSLLSFPLQSCGGPYILIANPGLSRCRGPDRFRTSATDCVPAVPAATDCQAEGRRAMI